MYRAVYILILALFACTKTTEAENVDTVVSNASPAKAIKQPIDFDIQKIIMSNDMGCLLSINGKVFCWPSNIKGTLTLNDLVAIDFGGRTIQGLYGSSGENAYFQTGGHICAILKDGQLNAIRCWGRLSDDYVLDADLLFGNLSQRQNLYQTVPVKQSVFGGKKINRLLLQHGVLCGIDDQHTLHCPHPHLAFLNKKEQIKHAVIGEVLSCVQGAQDNEFSCFDMRLESSEQAPIFVNLSDESWPSTFQMRHMYAAGLGFVTDQGALLYWQGALKSEGFPSIYGIQAAEFPLESEVKVEALYMSEQSACAKLSDGRVYCWGRPVDFVGTDSLPMPGKTLSLAGPVADIALGLTQNCFLVAPRSVECFAQPSENRP